MKFYAIAEINISNPEWVSRYAETVTKLVETVGGKYLARTSEAELIEGDGAVANISLIIEFPSREAAYLFYESQNYAPFLNERKSGSTGRFILVAGKDDARQVSSLTYR